jgi:hypothetical protein
MANVKISDLPAAASAQLTMQLEVNDSGTSRRVTAAQVDDLLLGTTNGFVARTGTNARAARTLTAGTGISISNGNGASGNPTITNSAPDQPVTLSQGTGITVTGSYPSFTVAAINNGTVTSITAGTGLTGGAIATSGTIAADIATDANIHAGTANKVVAAGQLYTANAPVATSGTGTYTIDMTAGRVFQRTMTGNTTLANPTTEVAGMSGVIYFIQDATGGRTLSLSSDWKPIGGAPSITTAANAVNVFSYYVRSANNISLSYLGAE